MRFQKFIFGMLLCVSCGDSQFQGSGGQLPKTEEVNGNIRQTFPLNALSKKVDIVWVIDNSGSMSNEAQIVQSNFASFLNMLGGRTDLKLALISHTSGPTSVVLPTTNSNYVQVPIIVGSHDGMEIAVEVSQSQLAGFFRTDAHRIYIFVTDDDAMIVNETNFLSRIQPTMTNGGRPTVFGFIGKFNATCNIATIGKAYEIVAQQTGGETFDICAPNWSQNFNKLTSSVEAIASTEFILNQIPKAILSVKVDGVVLNPTQYSLLGNKLIINKTAVSAQNKQVVIEYSK